MSDSADLRTELGIMAEYLISIQIETDQPEVLANIIDTLENVLPYMGDNVLITTKVVHD